MADTYVRMVTRVSILYVRFKSMGDTRVQNGLQAKDKGNNSKTLGNPLVRTTS